jgi:hypothetical protein
MHPNRMVGMRMMRRRRDRFWETSLFQYRNQEIAGIAKIDLTGMHDDMHVIDLLYLHVL